MANIILVNPSWENKGGIWKEVSSCFPPIGLLYIASVLEQAGHNVKVIDKNVNYSGVRDFVPDYFGVTITTVLANEGYKLCEEAKKKWPNCKTILGGVHATVMPYEALKHCDIVVKGEGELVINEIISQKKQGIIEGKKIEDLDSLPMPAYHLLDMSKYHPAIGSYKQLPASIVVTSRGCPNHCAYCYQPFGRKVRQRSPQKILDEIQILVNDHGIREIAFYDDNFTTIKKNIDEFCKLFIKWQKEWDIQITWTCFARADWLKEDTAKLMKQAGCHQILFGVESGNEHIRQNIVQKNLNLNKVFETNKMLQKLGIQTRASFMFGLPEETKQTMQETIDLAIKLNPDVASFNIIAPNPGTRAYQWGKENNCLDDNWESYDLANVKLHIPTATDQEILNAYKKAHRKFYLRPKYILKKLFKNSLKNNLQGLKAVLKTTKH